MNTYEITPLEKCYYPSEFIFFDTESFIKPIEKHQQKSSKKDKIKEPHTLRLGVCIYVKRDSDGNIIKRYSYYFYSSDDFWDFVEKHVNRSNALYIYAHNIKYDLANVDVIEQLKKRGWNVPYPVISHNFIMSAGKEEKNKKPKENGKPRKSTFKRNIHFIDTFNYAKESLKSIGKKVGIPKMEIDLKTDDEKLMFQYCENDVLIVEKFILSFIDFLKRVGGSLKNTIASTAFDVYRHKFIETPIHYHRDKELLRIERNGYRGGRVECFHIGTLPDGYYFYLDVNSMYPTIMSNCKLPYKPYYHSRGVSLPVFKEIVKRTYVIADVLIRDNHPIGIYGLKHDDKLIFPNNEFRVTLHQPELERAIKDNSVIEVYEFICYDADIVLKKYVDFFYEMKKNATNKTDYELSKVLMNSLYGRFAMRKYLQEVWNITDEMGFFEVTGKSPEFAGTFTLKKGKEILTYYHWFNQLVRSYSDDFIPVKNTNVALAGAVTAYARMLLFKYMEIAGRENIFYGDTDSLLTNAKGFRRLKQFIDEHELGYLKLELIADDAIIHAPKNYQIGDRVRSKGIPASAELNEEGEYTYWRFSTFKDYLREDTEFKGRVQVTKKNTLEYNKGKVHPNGVVSPYKMEYDKQCQLNRII